MIIFVRSLASVLIFCLPLFLYVLGSRQQNIGLILLIPMFGIVPALIGAWLIFAPLEMALDRHGLGSFKNVALPLFGALLPILFMVIMGLIWGNLSLLIERMSSGGVNAWGPQLFWVVLGALWGGVWRVSEWIIRLIGMQTGG